ncbi:unnamed protein product [Lupinus luteus]|uniref:Uncharacterized protein n=1 Tax=Lupinus luteus TaxID=3873 RepID=A0AAV1Y1F1_LUPLU
MASIPRRMLKTQHYRQALEISERMVIDIKYELSDSDYAVAIDLMTKVFGIDAAKHCFEGLPLAAKTNDG